MEKKKYTVDSVFALVLFVLFAITALFVTSSGALAYKNVSQTMEERFDRSTCVSYITAKIRGNTDNGKITVESFCGNSALCIRETINDSVYTTYIYCSDGAVRELFCLEGLELGADAGSVIADAQSLSFSEKGNLITARLTDNQGKVTSFSVCL